MAAIEWDKSGERFYETGTTKGVLYVQKEGKYQTGVPWNGLTAITESPSGAEATDLYADDIKYATLRSAEDFGMTIEAYTYPDEFAQCDGSAEPVEGVFVGQQTRNSFGLTYRTKVGNDVDENLGYKLHLVWGATASPSEKSYASVNDSPEAITFSWEVTTIPVNITGYKPTASIIIDSTKADKEKLEKLEGILYGTTDKEATLPTPDQVVKIMTDGNIPEDVYPASLSSAGKPVTSAPSVNL